MPSNEATAVAYFRRFERGAVKGMVLSVSPSSIPSMPPKNEYEAPLAGRFSEELEVGEPERNCRGGVGGRKVEGGGVGSKVSDNISFRSFSRH